MTISKKSRTRALVGAAVAGVALTGLAVTAATAGGTGTFIKKADLPQASQYTPWTAQAKKAGLPKPMYTCIAGILPAGKSNHVTFRSDMTAEVREIITVAKNKTEAKALVAKLRSAIANCDDKLDDVTDIDRVARYNTADGLTLDAVYTAPRGLGVQLPALRCRPRRQGRGRDHVRRHGPKGGRPDRGVHHHGQEGAAEGVLTLRQIALQQAKYRESAPRDPQTPGRFRVPPRDDVPQGCMSPLLRADMRPPGMTSRRIRSRG